MITIKTADVQPILTIFQSETNLKVRTKLEQWAAVYAIPGTQLPSTNTLLGIANSSSQKAAIVAWTNSLTP
jgi:hypothetical protein